MRVEVIDTIVINNPWEADSSVILVSDGTLQLVDDVAIIVGEGDLIVNVGTALTASETLTARNGLVQLISGSDITIEPPFDPVTSEFPDPKGARMAKV